MSALCPFLARFRRVRNRSHYKIASVTARPNNDPLQPFHPAVRAWFNGAFEAPTRPQTLGWPAIARGDSTLILAPTGSGKTLAAFLFCLDRLMFTPEPPKASRCRVLYVSPLKALAADVERNLRAPLAGIAQIAERRGDAVRHAGDRDSDRRHAAERARPIPARAGRHPDHDARIAVSAPDVERARGAPLDRHVIIDEIHALVPTKRGAHLALSIERLAALGATGRLQRIGLSATQRPLDEVARFLGGVERVAVAAPQVDRCRGRNRRRVRQPSGRGPLPAGDHRRRRREEGAEAHDRGAGRRHGAADDGRRSAERPRVGRRRAAVDLVGHSPAAARADSRPSLDARSSSTAAGWRNAWPAR